MMAKKKTSRKKVIWLSRDKRGRFHNIHYYHKKPQPDKYGNYVSGQGMIHFVCNNRLFRKVTGVKLRPGECVRIKKLLEI